MEGRKEEREGGIAQKVATTKRVSGFKGTQVVIVVLDCQKQSLCTYSSGLPIMRAGKRLRIDRKGTEPGPAERKTAPPRPFRRSHIRRVCCAPSLTPVLSSLNDYQERDF